MDIAVTPDPWPVLRPPSRRWVWMWRVGAVFVAVTTIGGGLLRVIDDPRSSSLRWELVAVAALLVVLGAIIVIQQAGRPRSSGRHSSVTALSRRERTQLRRSLFRGQAPQPSRRHAAAAIAGGEAGTPLVCGFLIAIAGQNLLQVGSGAYDDMPWLKVLSTGVAALLIVTSVVALLLSTRLRRTVEAAGAAPGIDNRPA